MWKIFTLIFAISLCNALPSAAADEKCSLKPELIAEVQSYQSVVDKIVSAAVNGSFSGNTWKRLVFYFEMAEPRCKSLDEEFNELLQLEEERIILFENLRGRRQDRRYQLEGLFEVAEFVFVN